MNHTFNDFLAGRIAIRCDAKDEYDRLMQMCEERGLAWIGGDRPTADGFDRFKPGYTYTLGDVKGKLMRCTELNRPANCRGCHDEDCAHRNAVPFSAIFSADPWADFLAGKCYLRVTKDEWPEFAERCDGAGIKWQGDIGRVADYLPSFCPYALICIGGFKDRIMQTVSRNPGPTDKPIRPFAAIARPEPQPYDGRGKHKAGDKLVLVRDVTTYRGNTWHTGDVVTLVREDMSDNALFRHDKTGEEHYQYWRATKPLAPTARKIIITTDGRVTTAKLIEGNRTIKTATATCSPEDEFDFATGARMAFGRLNTSKPSEIRVRVSVDTSALDAALQSVRDALKDLPNHTKAVKA